MEPESFCGARKSTRVTIIRKAYEAVPNAPHAGNVVLPPAAGDTRNQGSDIEGANVDPEESYEPAGELEGEEEIQ